MCLHQLQNGMKGKPVETPCKSCLIGKLKIEKTKKLFLPSACENGSLFPGIQVNVSRDSFGLSFFLSFLPLEYC